MNEITPSSSEPSFLHKISMWRVRRSESRLNGRVYAAAGQTVASLHTKAYQTDLLKDLDKVLYNPGLSPNNQGS